MEPFELEDGTIINLASVQEFSPKYLRLKYIFRTEYTMVTPTDVDNLIKALKPKRTRKAAPKERPPT